MFAYAIRRIVIGMLMLVVMSMITYVLFFASSPQPERFACGPKCTDAQLLTTKKALGFDKPLPQQWAEFAKGLAVGRSYPADKTIIKDHPELVIDCDAPCFGVSQYYQRPVRDLLTEKLPISASLAVMAFILWMGFAVALGIVAALFKGRLLDRGIVGGALLAFAFPTFFVGLLFLQYLCIHTPGMDGALLDIPSYTPFSESPIGWLSGLMLPAITLALVYMAGYVRITRAFVLETMSEDYIRTARAKGLPQVRVIGKHTLRAVLTPLVTLAGLDLAGLLGGAIITESVFNYNGLGKLTISAIAHFDLPIVVGIVLLVATFVIVANIIVDLLYAVIDPRVRLG